MSIQSEISRIETAKADLKTAIEAKGGTIADGTSISAYAAALDAAKIRISDVEGLEDALSGKSDKTVTLICTLYASGWSGAAPYSQTVSVSGLTEANCGHVLACAALSNTQSLAQSQQEAWNMVSRVTAAAGGITAVCFEEKPQTDIPVRLEVLG